MLWKRSQRKVKLPWLSEVTTHCPLARCMDTQWLNQTCASFGLTPTQISTLLWHHPAATSMEWCFRSSQKNCRNMCLGFLEWSGWSHGQWLHIFLGIFLVKCGVFFLFFLWQFKHKRYCVHWSQRSGPGWKVSNHGNLGLGSQLTSSHAYSSGA